MMRTDNPVLSDKAFSNVRTAGVSKDVMTLDGTVNKTIISVGITVIFACLVYANPNMMGLILPFAIAGLLVGLVISFKPNLAPLLTPVYAGAEGTVLGAISRAFESQYQGIVFQAVALTMGVLFSLLVIYKSGKIKVTDNFRLGVAAATMGIFLTAMLSLILGLFGVHFSFLHDSSPLSIGISLVVVGIASLNLVLDFDFIERGAQSGSMPKYMEWYGAFGLLVTLVWLYVSILRLLAKLQDRR